MNGSNQFSAFVLIFAIFINFSCKQIHEGGMKGISSVQPNSTLNHAAVNRSRNQSAVFIRIGDIPAGKVRPRIVVDANNNFWLWRGGSIWKSASEGKHWSLVHSFDDTAATEIIDLAFETGGIGWLVAGKSVLKTSDGGFYWSKDDFFGEKFEGVITSVAVSPEADVVLLGGGDVRNVTRPTANSVEWFKPAVFFSYDKGKNWTRAVLPNDFGTITKVHFVNNSLVLAIGELNSAIYFSKDKGRSWARAQFGTGCISPSFQNNIDYKPVEVASFGSSSWISFNDGRILKNDSSIDVWCDLALPGEIWKEDEKGLAYFDRLCFITPTKGFGLKANGDLFFTSSGGREWFLHTASFGYGDLIFSNRSCYFASDKGIFRTNEQ